MEAFHLDGAIGPIFCVAWTPPASVPVRFGMVCVSSFAEENNKSRRMLALQAQAFAQHGAVVILADLTGTGDSLSEFKDATWSRWQRDLEMVWAHLETRVPGPRWLWALRSGALLAVQMSYQRNLDPTGLLLWQPVVSGKVFVNQFLRLAAARQMMGGGEAQSGPRQMLGNGSIVEVAGYELNPELLLPMEGVALTDMAPACPVIWLECSSDPQSELSPASLKVVSKWRDTGVNVASGIAQGQSFWASQEIEASAPLIDLSTRLTLQSLLKAEADVV